MTLLGFPPSSWFVCSLEFGSLLILVSLVSSYVLLPLSLWLVTSCFNLEVFCLLCCAYSFTSPITV